MVLGLVLGLGLALALPGIIRDFLVDPIFRIIFYLEALPHVLVWLGVVVFFALWAIRAARRPRPPPPPSAMKAPAKGSRAEELTALLRRARYSPWARRALRTRLARVAVALRCEREKIPPAQAWAELRQERWPPDPFVCAFFHGAEAKNFGEALARVVEALERYALGGEW